MQSLFRLSLMGKCARDSAQKTSPVVYIFCFQANKSQTVGETMKKILTIHASLVILFIFPLLIKK